MDRKALENLVADGEGDRLEFKKRMPEPRRLAKEVIALANSGSGKVLLGVEDDGTILGVKDSYEEEYAIRKALEEWCVPPVRWNLRRVPVSRKREVLVISIPTRRTGPHYLRRESSLIRHDEVGIAYVRLNDESIEASPEAVLLMEEEAIDGCVHFEFGKRELALMQNIDRTGRVTSRSFAENSDVSLEEARKILVTLVRGGVLTHHISRGEDFFTLLEPVEP